ncbi:MAG: T9SS type A sorting domain-containing protein [Ignavibacteriales bacterium]|nr:T9SS type A sorting domain-containing protein [Ignavibacteriales bacterium]
MAAALLFISNLAFAQFASDYFPGTVGNSWRYSQYDLDTLQNIVPATKTTILDTITTRKTVLGLSGSLMMRTGKYADDTLLLRPEGSIMLLNHSALLVPLTSSRFRYLVDSLGFIALMNRSSWFPYMRFAAATGAADTLVRIDTTIDYNGGPLLVTLVVTTARLASKTVAVPAGTFTTTPFLLTLYGSGFIKTPVSSYTFRLLRIQDTLYVAKNAWVVKEVQGTSIFPYETLPVEDNTRFILPGFSRSLESSTITAVSELNPAPAMVQLIDNYPNPFNPSTTIRYRISAPAFVTVCVYDLLGRKAATLVQKNQAAGEYSIAWDAAERPSGVYCVVLDVGGRMMVRKVVMEK